MNIYYSFYCRAYSWYNNTGKKSKDTLRISAIALLWSIPTFLIFITVGFLSVLKRHTLLNKWVAVLIFFTFMGINLGVITSGKSDILNENYESLPELSKKRINILFFSSLFFLLLATVAMMGYTAYIKKIYGNYDL